MVKGLFLPTLKYINYIVEYCRILRGCVAAMYMYAGQDRLLSVCRISNKSYMYTPGLSDMHQTTITSE